MKATKKTSSTVSTQMQAKKSLFDSIISNELMQSRELHIQSHANRVGLLLKVLYNRELCTIRDSFEDELSNLVQKYCNIIDDELSTKKED